MIDYPSDATLKKYGLSKQDFAHILTDQDGVCPICGKVPNPSKKTGKRRWVIDHMHVKGWKKMPPEKRKQYVRGITCWFCNRNYLAKAMTVDKAYNLAHYLEDFEEDFLPTK